MMTLTVLTALLAIGFMVNGAVQLARKAVAPIEISPDPVTQMPGRKPPARHRRAACGPPANPSIIRPANPSPEWWNR